MDRAALRIQKLHRVFRAKQELMRRQQTVAAERIQGLLKIKAAKAEVESRRYAYWWGPCVATRTLKHLQRVPSGRVNQLF